ncbi:MAG: beta-lactamase family protein, partial [bacterium]|nr:beta-lactamase family protein [bacterium]
MSPTGETAFAQEVDRAKTRPVSAAVDDLAPLLNPVLDKYNLPAMAAAIVQGRCTVGLGAVGVRQLGGPQKVSVDDRFHLGSCTKSITATLCARLVEQGRLSWDTSIGQVFPELVDSMHSSYRGVTLEQLLTNRGGVPHDVPAPAWKKLWAHRGSPAQARRLLLEQIIREKPQAAPGTTYVYSNAGFSIAGHMVERVTGESWEDLVVTEIFKPLEMAGAGFGAPGSPEGLDQPRGHTLQGRPIKPGPWGQGDNPIAIGPAGSVHCSIGDWAKYVAMHLRGARADATFLKPDTFAKLHTPVDGPGDKYAMGWLVTSRDWGGGAVLT